jgi:hypothetical protein
MVLLEKHMSGKKQLQIGKRLEMLLPIQIQLLAKLAVNTTKEINILRLESTITFMMLI